MPLQISVPLLTIANLLIPIAILTFASGFFPYKPFLPGTATFGDVGVDQVPEAPFNKVVFMVVDALRRFRTSLFGLRFLKEAKSSSDFVYSPSSGFRFTQR